MLKETEIKEKVFEKIRTGEVLMRPRIYFIARVALLAFLSITALALAVFVLSFTFFSIHESGEQFLLGFGRHGLLAFIVLFPWWPLLMTLALIFLLDYLLRYFKFGYRVSVLEIFLIALAFIVVAGVAINFTPLHAALLDTADRGELPFMGPLYEGLHDSHQEQGVYRGTIASVQGNAITIVHNDADRDTDDGTSTVVVPAGFDMSTLHPGDRIYAAGKLVQGVVYSYGIEEFTTDER